MAGREHPNVLFLMSDEHRADVTGYEGDEVIRTPTLDRLARSGVVFRNAYAPAPVCIPGRQSMMVGQLPRTCACERFGRDLAPGAMTFAQRFAQFAYMTACCGKLHHVARDQMQGWTQRYALDMFVYEKYIKGRDEAAVERYGAKRHPRWGWGDLMVVHRARPDDDSRNQRFDNRATQAAVDFLEDYFVDLTFDRSTPDRPLMLKLSLLQPHYPYITPRDKLTYYFNRVEPFVNETVFDHPFLSRRSIKVPEEATPREVRRATAAYYGMVETVDDHFGRALDMLRRVGEDPDDWLIIYTSDHGEMLGEHSVWAKGQFFEASARVPLIIRPPRAQREAWGIEEGGAWDGRAGRVVEENVNLCDLFATLCDMCDVPLPEAEATGSSDAPGRGLDSRSLVPLMRGETAEWHERWHDETISQYVGNHLMIKRGALKYQYYGPPEKNLPEVLFDLEADPHERRNAIHDPAYAQAVTAFRRRCAELGFGPDADPDYRNAGYGGVSQSTNFQEFPT